MGHYDECYEAEAKYKLAKKKKEVINRIDKIYDEKELNKILKLLDDDKYHLIKVV